MEFEEKYYREIFSKDGKFLKRLLEWDALPKGITFEVYDTAPEPTETHWTPPACMQKKISVNEL